jgi:pyridoxal phosphate enzyme (YggS family)
VGTMQATSLESRYNSVLHRIAEAARRAGRRPSEIILVAVTKNADPEQIRGLLQLGHRDFGESRVQMLVQHAAVVGEYLDRQRLAPSVRQVSPDAGQSLFGGHEVELKPVSTAPGGVQGVRWHMIGHLQRNKARKIMEFVRLIHSVDSLRLAEELQTIAMKRDQVLEVLLQVNCSGESQKHGCPPAAAEAMAEQIHTMVNLRLRGLMTMAQGTGNPEDARPAFARCREIFEEIRAMKLGDADAPFNILSMGMSNDFEVAISEGANIVRVGTAIFGEKPAGPERAEPDEEDD